MFTFWNEPFRMFQKYHPSVKRASHGPGMVRSGERRERIRKCARYMAKKHGIIKTKMGSISAVLQFV